MFSTGFVFFDDLNLKLTKLVLKILVWKRALKIFLTYLLTLLILMHPNKMY